MENLEKLGTHTMDELGRVLIPRKIREQLGWKDSDKLAMYCLDENTLLLKKELEDAGPGAI